MKVFISSTYKDLIEYRAAAIRAVEGTNYQASKMEVGAQRAAPLRGAPLQEALAFSRRAVEIYTRLRHPELQAAQKTLAVIEAKLKA